MATIYNKEQELESSKKRVITIEYDETTEIVFEFTGCPGENRAITTNPLQLISVFDARKFLHPTDPRLPKEFRDAIAEHQKKRTANEGLTFVSVNAPDIVAKKILERLNPPSL